MVAFGMGWTYIVMLVAAVLQDLGLTIADWGTLWSAISLGTVLCAILGGALGDRFGIRFTVGLGVIFMGVFLTLRGTAASFATLYTWMLLFGIALAVTFSNVPKALGMWFPPEEFGLANGVTQAGYGAGAGLATVLTPLIVDSLGGWRSLTYLLGMLSIGLGVLWVCTVRDRSTALPEAGRPAGNRRSAEASAQGEGCVARRRLLLLAPRWVHRTDRVCAHLFRVGAGPDCSGCRGCALDCPVGCRAGDLPPADAVGQGGTEKGVLLARHGGDWCLDLSGCVRTGDGSVDRGRVVGIHGGSRGHCVCRALRDGRSGPQVSRIGPWGCCHRGLSGWVRRSSRVYESGQRDSRGRFRVRRRVLCAFWAPLPAAERDRATDAEKPPAVMSAAAL